MSNNISTDEKVCCPDYENEYYRQQQQICILLEENEKLKQALINLALQFK